MSLTRVLLILSIAGLSFFTMSCEEEEDNKIAQAQKCVDDLDDSDPDAAAEACEAKIDGITSQESYVIRCAVGFFVGGLKTQTILDAFEAYENETNKNEKAAILIGGLSQVDTAAAQRTFDACEASGVRSLKYVASASLTGTIMTEAANSTDPATFLAYCDNSGNGGQCNDAAVGTAVESIYESYCVGDAKETPICTDVASAINEGAGDPAAIAIALYQFLQ